jgi:hypothetical protein
MDERSPNYAVGYGKPPVETRFQKGQSGNLGGRPRERKTVVTLLGEALSRRSGYPKADGSWMTQAEAILSGLVAQAAGSDLKAKKLLFDLMVRLQGAPVWARHLPEIELDEGDGEAGAKVSVEIDRLTETISQEAAAHNEAAREPTPEPQSAENADPVSRS